ncbi:MAG: hypothetical protein WC851_01985 [Candidatus Shapirobacteria bacterium]|jgi:hypothetical protein
MNNQILPTLKFILAILIISVFASKFLEAYNTNLRNEAIDGCANQSSYQAQFEENKKTITVREPQKYLYDKCLVDKNIR